MAQPARINQVVAAWVAQRGVAACIADSKLPGGWEATAQTELAHFFKQRIPCLVAQREVREVFPANPGQKVDFVCPTGTGVAPPFFIIELKCQSTFQDSVHLNRFVQRLQADLDKVQQAVRGSFEGAEKWVIGVCCNMDIAQATVAYNFLVNNQPYNGMNVIPVQAANDVVQVFYARFV